MENNFDTICFSGGGIKGISFIGVIEYLEKKLYINTKNINNWVGTSIGAIFAFIYSLGYTTYEIKKIILEFNFNKLEPNIDIDCLLEFNGIDNGNKFIYIMKQFIKKKFNIEEISFSQLFQLTNNKLTIIGTNFSKGTEAVFNIDNTPDMLIIDALRISISIPIIFTPILYNSDYYIDGAIINNFPIKYCNPLTTLGIYIKSGSFNQLNNIITLITGCLSIMSDVVSLKDCSYKIPYIIEINDTEYEFAKFDIDYNTKLKIINMGKKYAKLYLKSNIQNFIYDKETQTDTKNNTKYDINQKNNIPILLNYIV
jgi:NTE family protein